LRYLTLVVRAIIAGILALAVGSAHAKETPEAKAVLDRAVAAMGGEKSVYGVKTLVVKGESTRITASGKTTSPATAYFLFPMSVRQEVVIEGKTIAMASNPQGAFLDSEAGPQELPESARHTLETSAMRNPVALLKGRRGRMFEATLAGRERIGDADVDVVEIKIGPNTTMLAVDDKGRMVEQRYDVLTESGRKGRMVVRFDDFRRDGSFFYPHKVRAELDGNFVYENTIAEVKRDLELDPRLFAAGFGPAYTGRPGPPMK
jgi:hypothetical protein